MKISKLTVTGQGNWPELQIENLDRRMNVLFAPPRAGKSTIAQLVGHLLYGKLPQPGSGDLLPFGSNSRAHGHGPVHRPQEYQTPTDSPRPVPGTVQVESVAGRFTLRRQYLQNQSCRLTITASDGKGVDEKTIPALLAHLPPTLLSRLYTVDFTQSPRIDWLLDESFSRQLQDITEQGPRATSSLGQEDGGRCGDQRWGKTNSPICHEPLDTLVRRRDDLARQLAEQLSQRRAESETGQSELDEVEAALTDHRGHAENLRDQLRGIETRLTDIEVRLRYFSLERIARQVPRSDGKRRSDESQSSDGELLPGNPESRLHPMAELDAEISRCRHTLRDLETRAATLRGELAQVHPDGTADRVSSLADGRATLGVLEQLTGDLDAEISQLARANQPARCVGHDAHTRLSPLAEMIRQQIYALCGQLSEQERAVRRQQVETEQRQLARAQTDLGEQLEHLLSRRETLVRASQSARHSGILLPQAPVPKYCQCERHGPFLQDADSMILARTDCADQEVDAEAQRRQYEEQRVTLRTAIERHEGEIDRLQSRWQQLQRHRATLIDAQSLDSIRKELQELEREISLEINHPRSGSTATRQARTFQPDGAATPRRANARTQADWKVWRASDILAQLTAGRLVQIRLQRTKQSSPLQDAGHPSRALTLIDRDGQPRNPDSLTGAEQDQLTLALTLALVAAHARHGIELPLLLDEPFLRQDQAAAAAMAGLLDQFARAGQQILVFTENRHALRHFQSLRSPIHQLDSIRRQQPSGHAQGAPRRKGTTPITQGTPGTTRISPAVSQASSHHSNGSADDNQSPCSKDDPPVEPRETGPLGKLRFYLEPDCPVEDAPSIGPKTAGRLAKVGIRSVADLLHADPESTAEELDASHINPRTITAWQQQARLVCRIPQLRGFGAQLLVACKLTEPEQLVGANSNEIVDKILAFCATKQGQRILRGSDTPSRARIEGWIRNASYPRSLEAA